MDKKTIEMKLKQKIAQDRLNRQRAMQRNAQQNLTDQNVDKGFNINIEPNGIDSGFDANIQPNGIDNGFGIDGVYMTQEEEKSIDKGFDANLQPDSIDNGFDANVQPNGIDDGFEVVGPYSDDIDNEIGVVGSYDNDIDRGIEYNGEGSNYVYKTQEEENAYEQPQLTKILPEISYEGEEHQIKEVILPEVHYYKEGEEELQEPTVELLSSNQKVNTKDLLSYLADNNRELFFAIAEDARNLSKLPPQMRNDENIIFRASKAMEHGDEAIRYASDRLQNNESFIQNIIALGDVGTWKYIQSKFFDNENIVEMILSKTQKPEVFFSISKRLRNNETFMNKMKLKCFNSSVDLLSCLEESDWNNAGKVKFAIKHSSSISIKAYLPFIVEKHKGDAEIMERITQEDFTNVKFASKEAIQQSPALQESYKKNKQLEGFTNGTIPLKKLDKKYFLDIDFYDKVVDTYMEKLDEAAEKTLEDENINEDDMTVKQKVKGVVGAVKGVGVGNLAKYFTYIGIAKVQQSIKEKLDERQQKKEERKQRRIELHEEIRDSIKDKKEQIQEIMADVKEAWAHRQEIKDALKLKVKQGVTEIKGAINDKINEVKDNFAR